MDKVLERVLSRTSDANIRFDDLCHLLSSLGFEMRVRGSHHIFRKAGVEEKINLQREGSEAKPYQVRQVRAVDPEVSAWRSGVMNKYEVIIYWSEEDQVFVAEVPELPGCSAHGATHEAALASAQEAIRLWIDTAREFGDPIPVPKGRRLIFA
jgi:predicted RNase H-like HicB family nuclease